MVREEEWGKTERSQLLESVAPAHTGPAVSIHSKPCQESAPCQVQLFKVPLQGHNVCLIGLLIKSLMFCPSYRGSFGHRTSLIKGQVRVSTLHIVEGTL